MDLIVPHSWLTTYCKTKKSPKEIAALLSRSGPSIDRLEKIQGDFLYHVEITTNRVDAFSIYGFAREAAVILGAPFQERMRKKPPITFKKNASASRLIVTISAPNLCNRYIGAYLEGVVVKDSPLWMQKRLQACGIRAINNVVDITNYVMLEYGQPMHAFDANLLAGKLHKEIIVRAARAGELFTTLDGDEKKLNPSMLVIADAAGALALAGIKGGKRAGISAATTTIVLESAHFDAVNVRTTSRALDLRTDSSARFEKHLSPELATYAAARAIDLLKEYACARLAGSPVDTYPRKEKPEVMVFDFSKVKKIVGVDIPLSRAKKILTALGFRIMKTASSRLTIDVPFWRRADVDTDVDFVEEIARIAGYAALPHHALSGALPHAAHDRTFFWERTLKRFFKYHGWTESMAYSMVSAEVLARAGIPESAAIPIRNPLSEEFAFLRPHLAPSMLEALSHNQQKRESLKLFEMSMVYQSKNTKKDDLPNEVWTLASALLAKGEKPQKTFLELKGTVEKLFKEVLGAQMSAVRFIPLEKNHALWQSGEALALFLGEKIFGYAGMITEERARAAGIKHPCAYVELSLSALLPLMNANAVFTAIPKYPAIVRDIACTISKAIPYAEVETAVRAATPLIHAIELFDVFESAKLGADKRSLAFHITYLSKERTLTSQEVDTLQSGVADMLKKKFSAEIR